MTEILTPWHDEEDGNEMPSLTPEEQNRLLGGREQCYECGAALSKNYCRQCDEFFGVGHTPDCPLMGPNNKSYSENHAGHRTY